MNQAGGCERRESRPPRAGPKPAGGEMCGISVTDPRSDQATRPTKAKVEALRASKPRAREARPPEKFRAFTRAQRSHFATRFPRLMAGGLGLHAPIPRITQLIPRQLALGAMVRWCQVPGASGQPASPLAS
eukprot:scaffold12093_cov137-Isochrysis_galbana.AAC.3